MATLSGRIPRRMAILGLVSLAGCGFTPIYGDNDGLRGKLAFDTEETVAGFRMRVRLEDRLGRPDAPQYVLRVTQSSSSSRASVSDDGDSTRFNVTGAADWTLTEVVSGDEVETGRVQSFTSYAATGSTVATQSARVDAEDRLAVVLADMIVSRILLLPLDTAS